IARIAKEGRKYGVSLCIITQRPGELDQTILSQCSTLFAMLLGTLIASPKAIASPLPIEEMKLVVEIEEFGMAERMISWSRSL
ncbi:hypothetical protein ACCS64_39110, partial [Rhizobium ruizarguesonis]